MNKNVLISRLKAIPPHCSAATIDGVTMVVIDPQTKEKLLAADPQDNTYHECNLKNGTFVFQTDKDHHLTELYKVMARSDAYRQD